MTPFACIVQWSVPPSVNWIYVNVGALQEYSSYVQVTLACCQMEGCSPVIVCFINIFIKEDQSFYIGNVAFSTEIVEIFGMALVSIPKVYLTVRQLARDA